MKRILLMTLLILVFACGEETSSSSENTPVKKITDSGKKFSIENLKKRSADTHISMKKEIFLDTLSDFHQKAS